jgi:hypothetical protein
MMSTRNSTNKSSKRVSWPGVIRQAGEIVQSYTTSVTLRQLFYRLIVINLIPNLQTYYRRLSEMSAVARRQGAFPDLLDRTSKIERYQYFASPEKARQWLQYLYRRDRTEGQEWTIFLGVEKAGISAQLDDWFSNPLGIPHVALGGYASQTLCDDVRRDVERQGRPAVLIYAGDMDPTGEDIDRDFVERCHCFDTVVRVALSEEQVDEFGLEQNSDPEVMDKLERDSRAKKFLERHGSLMQYEVDGLDPNTLRDLFRNAINQFWDDKAYKAVLAREKREIKEL